MRRNRPKRSAADHPDYMRAYHEVVRYIPMQQSPKRPEVMGFYTANVRKVALEAQRLNRKPAILITGAGDSGMLEVVRNALNQTHPGRSAKVNLIDVNTASLNRNIDWAKSSRESATIKMGDARRLHSRFLKRTHDAIVTDQFLYFFSDMDKLKVMRQWNKALRVGGKVITTFEYELPKNSVSEYELQRLRISQTHAYGDKARSAGRKYTALEEELEKQGLIKPFSSIQEMTSKAKAAGFGLIIERKKKDNEYGFAIDPWRNHAIVRVVLVKERNL